MFDTLRKGLDTLEEGVKKVSSKTIGEIGAGIVEAAVDAGTAIEKKVKEIAKELP